MQNIRRRGYGLGRLEEGWIARGIVLELRLKLLRIREGGDAAENISIERSSGLVGVGNCGQVAIVRRIGCRLVGEPTNSIAPRRVPGATRTVVVEACIREPWHREFGRAAQAIDEQRGLAASCGFDYVRPVRGITAVE